MLPVSQDLTIFQAAIETAGDAVLWMDSAGRIVYANQRACDWLGYAPKELCALFIWDVDVGTSLELWSASWGSASARWVTETVYRGKDDRLIPVEVSARNLDVGGNRVRVAFVRDVTQSRAVTDALRRTQAAVDRAREAIFWVRRDGSLAYVNDEACASLEYSREELLRLTVSDIDPNIPMDTWAYHWERSREVRSIIVETSHRTKTGRVFPVEAAISFMQFEGEEYNCVYTRDISERKRADEERDRLELQLLHAQKLESVGRLAGGVAHDFNNMLSVILGYADLISGTLPPGDPLLEPVGEIKKAADRSRDITRQLLAFSRKQVAIPQVVELNEVVDKAMNSFFRLIGEDIDLVFVPGEGLWRVVFDPTQVEQMLVNLIVNARDAMPEGGRITIQSENVEIDEAYCREHVEVKPGDYVVLSVSDEGVGMEEETLLHIFEPFFSTKEVGKGTGLGLATVYGVITQNGGFINVWSQPGRGSTFRLFIPRMRGQPVVPPAVADVPSAGGRGIVLLVEDDETVRELTRAMLRALGYTVLPAASGHVALSLCVNPDRRIDLLLSDIVMPDMKGPELRDRVRAIRPGLNVLFISGYAASVVFGQGRTDDSARFLEKPFTMAELARAVERAMRGTAAPK